MTWLIHESRLLFRSRISSTILAILFSLTSLAVLIGFLHVESQHETIARLGLLHEQNVQALAKPYASGGDAGYAAYYTSHNTWESPSKTAFLALGTRDIAPYALKIRALGLQAQLYDGETFNPELVLPGKFDFAFVLIYLAPLFVIAFLHDLVAVERESGRLRLLLSMQASLGRLWLRRTVLRCGALFSVMALPVLVGAMFSGTAPATVLAVLLLIVSYLAFWTGLCLLVNSRNWSARTNATSLMGLWVILTLVLPTAANLAIAQTVPVAQGVDLMLAQRQHINAAWDKPRDTTMQQFFKTHPEWKETAALPVKFHWKWYFAFQQLGDESVAGQSASYRAGLLMRQDYTSKIGWLLPGVAAQGALHRLAETDLFAQLEYQDRITRFHEKIRTFYYPYIFNEQAIFSADFKQMPQFAQISKNGTATDVSIFSLSIVGLLLLLGGYVGVRKLRLE